MSKTGFGPIIGVDVDDLPGDIKESVRAAADLQFRAVEAGATAGPITPRELGPSGRKHFRRFVESFGLTLRALTADMPDLRLTDSHAIEERVERTCEILSLARDLGVPVVSARVGALTHPESGEPSPTALEGLRRIGEFADRLAVRFALRPTSDRGAHVATVLEAIRCPSIAVCLDPAAMVMCGASPVASLERYVDRLALVHARDGTAGIPTRGSEEPRAGHETPLGEGDVDLVGVLATLREGNYREPIILRRTESKRPREDLNSDRETLLRLLRDLVA